MTGFLGFAPIYLNGLLAIFFAFVLPGLVLVRLLDIPNFPQRWLLVVLGSLTANHLLVTLIAALHLDPLQTCRTVAAALIAVLLWTTARPRAAANTTVAPGTSIILASDLKWLVGSLVVLGFTYFNVWKHGVPNIFQGSDVSVSWNVWALDWSHGSFPASYGYPQFVPTTWATTYIFTGSSVQYFAYYSYIVLITVPIALCTPVWGRVSWRYASSLLFVFVWFVAEIQQPWLRNTLQWGFPDWVAAIFGFSGTALFVVNAPKDRFDREQMVTALLSLCLVSIAAATKPLYAMLAIAILTANCVDAARYLRPSERNRFIVAAFGLLAIFVTAYVLGYVQLGLRSMPNYPVAELSERLSRAAGLLNSHFTLPFRALLLLGFTLSLFLPRVRWLALPLGMGFWLWASTASYDLRNILGLLMISAFIPFYALARRLARTPVVSDERRWCIPDAAVSAGIAVLGVILTLPLAVGDEKLKQRFADEQLDKGPGIELNRPIGELLRRGCRIFSADAYIHTVSAFQPHRRQMEYFHYNEPLTDLLARQLDESTGCTGIMYPPGSTHPSILARIDATAAARGLTKVAEDKGTVLLAPDR